MPENLYTLPFHRVKHSITSTGFSIPFNLYMYMCVGMCVYIMDNSTYITYIFLIWTSDISFGQV